MRNPLRAACAARATCVALAASSFPLLAQDLHTFDKQQLSSVFFSEGATFGDLDNDGHADIVAGPFWYSGPEFTVAHQLYAPKPFDTAGYSDNFFAFVHDFDADGWNDVFVIGFPGQQATWYRNPKTPDGAWLAHVVFDGVDNESPTFTDLTGDGRPELVCQFHDQLGWAAPDWSAPEKPWTWHPASATAIGGRFTHGMGVGDVDGDGKHDILWKHGWWQQPASLDGDPQWQHHAVKFTPNGGAQMLVFDVDGDGDHDVVTSENAHGYGLWWFEQTPGDDGPQFTGHRIMGDQPEHNSYGVVVGNLHALCAADIDGDGLLDVVTGNRYFAHGGRDRADGEKPKVLWFELIRTDGVVRWAPHLIDDDSGVGTQVVVGDFTGDGRPDVVVGNKKGAFVHRHVVTRADSLERRLALAEELQQLTGGGKKQRGHGALPRGDDGRELNLDFETGDLRDWHAEGDAFTQVCDGDTVNQRRSTMHSRHQGRYWIGSYERNESDKPRGTLSSDPFVLDKPFASFLIGGGYDHVTRVEIVRADTGAVVFHASAHDREEMEVVDVDLRPQLGQRLFVRLVDNDSGGWGHVNFDDFRLHGEDDIARTGGFPAAEAAARMTLPQGFRVQVAAAEPDLHQPVAMAIDQRGRIWVAEAFSYPRKQKAGEGKDRIVVLEDPDGDGVIDQRTVFAQGLNLVSGLEVGFGGVFVGAAPELLFLPDRDGDLVPDGPAEVLLDGWHYEDTHETLNSFTWGPDGWLYGCHGVFTHSEVGAPGTPDAQRVPLNAGVFRFHPVTHAFEVFAHGTSNPWGVDFDEFGQCFITACVIPHLYHMVQGGLYRRQSGRHFNPYYYEDIKTIADHLHYVGASSHDGNRISDSAGGGHAHCGAMIYRGGHWPEPWASRIFMTNLHGHRLNTDILRRQGSGYVGSHGEDFLVSHDDWFMGVSFDYGPDGNVWMIDWYDQQTCHDSTMERWDRSNGRLYKVSYGDRAEAPRNLDTMTNAALVDLVFDANEYYSRRARRVLMERRAVGIAPLLQKAMAEQQPEPQRLRALWTLWQIGGLDDDALLTLLDDRHEHVRAFAVQFAVEDRTASDAQLTRFAALAANDPSPVVRLYLCSALQRLPHEQRWPIAAALVMHGEDRLDHNLELMMWYGVEGAVPADPARALALAAATPLPRLREFLVRRLAEAGSDGLEAIAGALAVAPDADGAIALLEPLRTSLERLGDAAMPQSWPKAFTHLQQLGDARCRELATWLGAGFGDPGARPALVALARNPAIASDERTRAFELLLRSKDAASLPFVQELVDDELLGQNAVRALGGFADDTVPAWLLDHFAELDDPRRTAAVEALTSRPNWAMQLLDAVAANSVNKQVLDAPTRLKLNQMGDQALVARLQEVWGISNAPTGALTERLAAYKQQLTPDVLAQADRSHGRALYSRTCMVCHKLFGQGVDFGPDITGSNRRDLDYLLTNILEPGAEVSRDYMMAQVHLKSGGIAVGMLADETDSSVTVRTQVSSQVIAKKDIQKIEHLPVSLMPPGQLDALSPDDVRDLIAYLQSDAQVPLRAQQGDGWRLFDGKSLAMWDANPAVWSVQDGELVGKSPQGLAHNDFAVSHLLLGDFELTFEVKMVDDVGNSGVQLRSQPVQNGEVKGYQADIGPGWWGKLYEELGRGLLDPADRDGLVRKGDWNRYRIVAEGTRVRTWLNDQPCVDRDDPEAAREGVLALQVHSGVPTEVRFRNFDLKVK